MSRGPGRLALVLHTHMPYVEGFGTWPFGEEWLWEAMATSYLPLLDVLDAHPGVVTVSITPVLADQLAAPGVEERFLAFLEGVREQSHALDLADADADAADAGVRAALEDSLAGYRYAAARFRARGGELLSSFAEHASWTSAATHALLPLLATGAGARLQLDAGIASHRARFGAWEGGLWLPECGYAPWLEEPLARAGVRHTCLDLTDTGLDPLVPLRSAAGPLLVGLDRPTIELVWSARGYPVADAYRDTHRRTARQHKAWANDGTPYDRERGRAQARADAADFVARVGERVAGGGLCVCAVDTELFGHWWHEGPSWLAAVLEQARRAGLEIVGLDSALAQATVVDAPELPVTSWGSPRDLSTWSSPTVAELVFAQRAAELSVFARGAPASPTALRELLHVQASDWAFLIARGQAGPYPRERVAGHLARLGAALRGAGDPAAPRHLAPGLG